MIPEGSPLPKNQGWHRLVNALYFSMNGFKATFRTEEAFRQEVLLSIILLPLGYYLGETPSERVILIGSILLVMIVELLNTAVERAIDRISFDRHELSKEAKDMGSAAVLLTIILAVLAWALILI
jgi:diacylglycerol kinase (ATP)